MANIKSAKKRIKVTEKKKTLQNKMVKSALKTAIKKFEAAVAANNAEEAKALFVKAAKSLDMAAQKGASSPRTWLLERKSAISCKIKRYGVINKKPVIIIARAIILHFFNYELSYILLVFFLLN